MKIEIIGGGSIGLLFAAYLSQVFPVTIYTRTAEQAAVINKKGILLRRGSSQYVFIVKARPIIEWNNSEGLTIIAVKQYQLPIIIKKMEQLSTKPQNLLFLQNGMGHLKLLEQLLDKTNIFIGTVEHGALKEDSFIVSHNGTGMTNLAVVSGDNELLNQLTAYPLEYFPFTIQNDFYQMLLNKLIINAVINPLTAVLGAKNGELIKNQFYFQALKMLFAEISSILNLPEPSNHLSQIINVCQQTADNRSSMLKDIEAGRLTEIDAILGFLIEEAEKEGKTSLQVSSLYYLIKGKEYNTRGVPS